MDGVDMLILQMYKTARSQGDPMPTTRDIASGVMISVGAAHRRIQALTRSGHLNRFRERQARAISLTWEGEEALNNYFGRSGKGIESRKWPPT